MGNEDIQTIRLLRIWDPEWEKAEVRQPDINTKSLRSSVITAAGYEEITQTLYLLFKSGKIYKYLGVPKLVAEELECSKSPGSYLNKVIKNSFNYELIEEEIAPFRGLK